MRIALELDGGMTNAVFLAEHIGERLHDGCALARWEVVDQYMARECIHLAGDTPDMKIMHILDTIDLPHIIHKLRQRDVFRGALKQDVCRFAQDMPGTQRDKRGNSDGEQGIGDCPACGENDETGNHYTYRCAHIAKDMESCCAHVQVTVFSPQAKTNKEIDDNTHSSREKHKQRLHGFW